jgi:predicted PurR-regulated permease PerM
MKNTKILFWLITIIIAGLVLYAVNGILMPFIMSLIFSYFFVPIANYLQTRFSISRTISALIIISIIIILLICLWLLIVPLIFDQIQHFIQQIPKYKSYVKMTIIPFVTHYVNLIDPTYVSKVEDNLNNIFTVIFQYTANFIQHIWQSGMAFINIISMLVLVPFITFYLVRDWPNMSKDITNVVPKNTQRNFKVLTSRIDNALSGFIRGQINVCLVLALYYSLALTTIGINFSIFIGITTGILAFIPFVGFLSGFICSLLVVYLQFFSLNKVLLVIGVFVIGSIIENTLSPKLIGNKIGLHPVWLIFALLVGADFFGFAGMLAAIPCAAVLNVLIRFTLDQYYSSNFYLGNNPKRIKKVNLGD